MKVVVIGAGPAGLVTTKSLLEAASNDYPFDPVILEQENDIGGTFRYRSYEVSMFNVQNMFVRGSIVTKLMNCVERQPRFVQATYSFLGLSFASIAPRSLDS